MAEYFLDSSALVKRYHTEAGSERVEQLFANAADIRFISRLAVVELHSAFARLVREGVLGEAELQKLNRRIEEDVVSQAVIVLALNADRLKEASLLLRTEGLKHSIRTLDAIQLATARTLHARGRPATCVAADRRLLATAAACSLPTLDVG